MLINVINPNSSVPMTEKIAIAARLRALAGTRIGARTSLSGPPSIEGHHDEAAALPGLFEQIREGEAEACDAHVIACFGDPGLRASREIARAPVVGIAEAGMHMASMLATHFSIVTTLARSKVIAEHLVLTYGMERICRRVRAIDIPVLALDDPASRAAGLLLDECRRALDEDGSDAIVLGCAGMADLAADLTTKLGVPVIDGVGAAVKLCEALVGLGLRTSKRGDYAVPTGKSE